MPIAGPAAAVEPARVTLCSLAAPDPELDAAWTDLLTRSGGAPFLGPDWMRSWSEAFTPDAPVRVLTIARDGRLIGLAPLDTRGQPPFNWHQAEASFLAEDADAARAVADAIFERRPQRLNLRYVRRDAIPLTAARAAASAHGYRSVTETVQRSPWVEVDGDWDRYEASLGKKMRKNIRRRRKKLEERGVVTTDVGPADLATLERDLDEAFRIEASGWKGEGGTAIVSRPEQRQFYVTMAERMARAGRLTIGFVRLDGRPIAFILALRQDGVHYSIKEGFDPEFAFASPGTLIFEAEMRYAFESGVRRVELMGEDTPHKMAWTDTVDERVRFAAFPADPRGTVDHLLHSRVRPVAKRVRRLLARGNVRRQHGTRAVEPPRSAPALRREPGSRP